MQPAIINPYSESIEAISHSLSTNIERGLSEEDIISIREKYGLNAIEGKSSESPFVIFISQFKSPFVLLLFIATALSFYFKEWLDGIAILVVIAINTVVGFIMEYQAGRSMEALKNLTKSKSKIIRNGRLIETDSEEIVPGDILFVEAGDVIPADARIITMSQLQVDESALTGESIPVEKNQQTLKGEITLAERINMLYKGTFVSKGNCKAIVTGTGMNTELGSIAAMVQKADQSSTPLEKKIEQFSKKILWLTVVLVIVIFLAGVLNGDSVVLILQTSIALAVAAIPEGLPIVTTLALAQGMLRMAKKNVIVKKLSAVETLGGTTVICTDKTGTLTKNIIEVNTIVMPRTVIEVKQDIVARTTTYLKGSIETTKTSYQRIIQISTLCNTAEISISGKELKEVGDPLETGLLKFAFCEGIDIEVYRQQFSKTKEEPFSSETKLMATAHSNEGHILVTAKGAVEELLKKCTDIFESGEVSALDAKKREDWIAQANRLAANGLRVIALAYRETDNMPDVLLENLVLAGLVGMIDPPREEVFRAISECKSAGIRVIMITGDHPETAKNIGLKIGLLDSAEDSVLHGNAMPDYDLLSNEQKKQWLSTKIFARVTPKQKLDLVSVLQDDHQVVGMTGDGVNDAPALKKADIGIAMGNRGTQVAQEVSDMVLKDDSFSSIVAAIKQGRTIFENIRRFVVYLLSCNLSELCIVAVSSVLNLHFALFPLQILYINLVTDVLPALALGITKGSNTIMKVPPRNTLEPIVGKKQWVAITTHSLVISACSLAAVFLSHYTVHNTENWNPALCNNILFITLILSQLLHVFNMTTDTVPFYKTDVFRNKYVWYALAICLLITVSGYAVIPVAKVLSLYAPSIMDISIMVGFSLLSLFLSQILKKSKVIA